MKVRKKHRVNPTQNNFSPPEIYFFKYFWSKFINLFSFKKKYIIYKISINYFDISPSVYRIGIPNRYTELTSRILNRISQFFQIFITDNSISGYYMP